MNVGEIIGDNVTTIHHIARTLSNLSQAFDRTGNNQVANELYEMSKALDRSADIIHKSYFEEKNVYVNQSLKNSQNFIGSILTDVVEGKDPKDACINAMHHNLEKDLIEDFDKKEQNHV